MRELQVESRLESFIPATAVLGQHVLFVLLNLETTAEITTAAVAESTVSVFNAFLAVAVNKYTVKILIYYNTSQPPCCLTKV